MSIGGSKVAGRGAQPLLIVTGLLREARIVAGPGTTVICSSSDPHQLRAKLAVFNPSTVRGIVSFGVAGGLCPSLRPGDVVVANEVIARQGRWSASATFSAELADSIGAGRRRVLEGGLAGVDSVVRNRQDKAALRAATSAVAVDMESHIAADYASAIGLPFAALRVVSDPAHRNLPELVVDALTGNGEIDAWKVARGLARQPQAIPALLRTAHDFNQALAALRGCRGLLLGRRESLIAANF